jgi:glycosyltransferase involved in cell wall biosynthesis
MRALIVLPTYNEADNIAEVLRRLRMAVPAADILLVDDASLDGTADIAQARGADLGEVNVLLRAGKLGLGADRSSGQSPGEGARGGCVVGRGDEAEERLRLAPRYVGEPLR